MAKQPSRFTHPVGGPLSDAPGWVRAAVAAGEGAFLSVALMVLPAFAVWLASPNASAGGWRAVQLGLAAWCLAHGGALSVGIGGLSLVPLLLTCLALATAAWAAQRQVAGLARTPRGRWGWAGGLRGDVAREAAAFVTTYALIGVLAALAARASDLGASLPRSALGCAAVGLLAYLWGLRWEFRADLRDVAPGWSQAERLPDWLRLGARAGLRAVGGLALAGMVAVILLLIVRFDRVAGLYGELSPGVLGGVVLTLVQVAYLPDFAVWALAWMAGAGFGVGADSAITLTQSTPGLMPLVPFLGALPEPGPLPVALRAAVLLPVLAGVLLERRTSRAIGPDPLDQALAAAAGCASAGALAGLLGVAASGSLGSARLADVGVPAFALGALLAGELALGAAASLGLRAARGSLAGAPPGDGGDAPAARAVHIPSDDERGRP